VEEAEFQWQFGGWLQSLSPAGAWALWGILLVLAIAAAWLSYGRTLQALAPGRRAVLVVLRALGLFTIFFCLANPVLLVREFTRDSLAKRYAVVVDRSESMLAPDNRRETRFDRAWARWLKARPAPDDRARIDFHVFGTRLQPVSGEDAVRKASVDGTQTALHASLAELLAGGEQYDEIICLTDGLDTADGQAEALIGQALAARVPLSFVPGENRLRPQATLRFLECSAPPRALTNTEISMTALLEIWTEKGGEIPVRLNRGGKLASQQTVTVGPGRAIRPVVFPISTGAPGPLELEIEAGDGKVRALHRTLVSVRDKMPVRILFYQGALDWGYRFFARALKSDPSFDLDVIFSPQTNLIRTASRGGGLAELPGDVTRLAPYDLIVLSQVFPGQLSAAQQKAIREYVRQGGAVLFHFSNSRAAQEFQNSVIEEILPVVFAPPTAQAREDLAARTFQERMRQTGNGSSVSQETFFAETESGRPLRRDLLAFEFAEQTPLAELFKGAGGEQIVPAYTEAAALYGAKPAAQVLAVADQKGGTPRVLLALQNFGQGRSALLATDMLWSWAMAQPSSSRLAATFWQQFATWLAQPGRRGLHFLEAPLEVAKGGTVRFPLSSTADRRLISVRATAPSGHIQDLPLRSSRDGQIDVELQPSESGIWTLTAIGPDADMIERTLTVSAHVATAENSGVQADLTGLNRLAETTGGRVLRAGEKLQASGTGKREPLLVRQSVEPLWNSWGLLLTLLGTFSAELLLRRHWKLL
jgi:hypothetical protein